MSGRSERYALYYCPPEDSDIGRFGQEWLSPTHRRPPDFVDDVELWTRATKSPAHYGFHGTLKAPFRLADHVSEAEFLTAVETAAENLAPFNAPPVQVTKLGPYCAFTFAQPSKEMAALHRTCVVEFELFRAPLNEAETAKRLRASLTSDQRALLNKYGYPYVLEEFRFHLTLAGPLEKPDNKKIHNIILYETAHISPQPLPVTDLCVFYQRDKDTSFNLLRRFSLNG
ncbi:MAG: DUF1045 domain-containing protein [Pseudomonadota bacterium]